MQSGRSTWVFSLLLFGCVDPIEIATTNKGGELVVSGQISNLEDQTFVTIGTTAESERLPFPIAGAIITLYEDNDSIGAFTESDHPGKYFFKERAGIPGKAYHVKVELPDYKTYYSAAEVMPNDAGAVDSYYEHAREEVVDGEGTLTPKNLIKIYANSTLPSTDDQFFRWTADEVYIIVASSPPGSPSTAPPCFVTQLADPQYFVLLDRENILSNEDNGKLLATRLVDNTFMYKHYFVTYQSALTADAYEYWRKVDILISGNGSLFDPPPAKVYGNIYGTEEQATEKVFGYFQATNQTVSRIFINRDDFPYYLNFSDCQSSFPPPHCIDCLAVQNSSYDRPPWF